MSAKKDFSSLSYEDFKRLAEDSFLSKYEKIGFPDHYREGYESKIFSDLVKKTAALKVFSQTIVDVGPGCSDLPKLLAKLCIENKNQLIFIDSKEMLKHLPDSCSIKKIEGKYPDLPFFFEEYENKVDLVIFYSVFQYIFSGGDMWRALDRSLSLLSDGGEIFLGDIPNITMRKRFFSSKAGIETHHKFTGTLDSPSVVFNNLEPNQIDDSIVFAILMRCRLQGFHAWVLPQDDGLPMANRREDILIRKP